MFCEKCGNPVKDTERFCAMCGAPIQHTTDKMESDTVSKITSTAQSEAKEITEKGKEVWSKISGKEDGIFRKIFNKKNKVPLISGAVVVVVLLLVIVNGARLNNFVHKTFTSPEKYYQFVEKKNAKEIASLGGEWYGFGIDMLNIYDKSFIGELSVELGEDGQELISLLGLTGVDVSWLKSVNIGVDSAVKNSVFKMGLSTGVNKDDIISGNLIMDMQNENVYVQIPELTKTYLGVELSDVLGAYDREMFEELQERQAANKEQLALLPKETEVEKLINKYLLIALGGVDDVSKGTKTLKVEGVQKKYTELKVTIDSETMQDIAEAVLEEMQDDKDIERIIEDVIEASDTDLDADDVYEEFVEEIEYILEDLQYLTDDDREFVMKVYVDGKGNIIGRSIEWESYYYNKQSISMLMPEKGNKFGYELSAEVDGVTVKLVGSGKHSGDVISGDFQIKYNGASLLDITAKKLNIEELKKGRLNGTLKASVSSGIDKLVGNLYGYMDMSEIDAIKDIELTLDSEATKHSGKYSLDVIYDEQDIGSITIAFETGDGSKTNIPSDKNTVMVEDTDDLEEWAESIVWDQVVSKFEKTDLPSDLIDLIEDIGEAIEDEEWDEIDRLLYRYYY